MGGGWERCQEKLGHFWPVFLLCLFFLWGCGSSLFTGGGGNDSAQLAGERGVGSKGMNGFIYGDVTVMGVIGMLSVTIVGA